MRMARGRTLAAAIAAAIAGLGLVVGSATDAHSAQGEPREVTPAVAASAQVVGSVVDREGGAVAGATVLVRPVGMPVTLGVATRVFETVTDQAGRFHVDGLPAGTYWFIALHAAHPPGSSPALPVANKIEVHIRLDEPVGRS